MPTEGESKPKEVSEPDQSPNSETAPSSKASPDSESQPKIENDSFVPPTPDEKEQTVPKGEETPSSTDEGKLIVEEADPPQPPLPNPIKGLNIDVTLKPDDFYFVEDITDTDDDEEPLSSVDDIEHDEEWITYYSSEDNPHWIAIKEACENIMNKARMTAANYDYRAKYEEAEQFDVDRLSRLCSQLTLIGSDFDELAVRTTPAGFCPPTKICNLLSLILGLSGTNPKLITIGDVRGKVLKEALKSGYDNYEIYRNWAFGNAKFFRERVVKIVRMWERYEGVFRTFCKETRALEETVDHWGSAEMDLNDLKIWNEELRNLRYYAEKLLGHIKVMLKQMMNQVDNFLKCRKKYNEKLHKFLSLDSSTIFTEDVRTRQF